MMEKMDSYPNLFEINLEQHQVCLGHQYAHVSARSIYHMKIYYIQHTYYCKYDLNGRHSRVSAVQ